MAGFKTIEDLPQSLLSLLESQGFHTMTKIQKESIPAAMAGNDILAQSKTGSGKTLAFGLPVVTKTDTSKLIPQTLIITPTRELADQVAQFLRKIAAYKHNLKILTLYGGVPLRAQADSLAKGAHILIGTPGRLLDHLSKGTLDLNNIHTLVFDEADRMLDMGFYDDILKISQQTARTRQTLLFSATFPSKIEMLAKTLLSNPEVIKVDTGHEVQKISQYYYESKDKFKTLTALIGAYQPSSLLIFANTKTEVIELADKLHRLGHSVIDLHGDLDQMERNEAVIAFANGSKKIMVATDVASRGLDIEGIDMVINYDLPFDQEVYTHRIGRTGRADATGTALSLISPQMSEKISYIKSLANKADPGKLRIDSHYRMLSHFDTLCINGGKKSKVRKGDILGTLCKEIGIDVKDIGKIDITEKRSYIALHHLIVEKVKKALQKGVKIKKKKYSVWVLD